MINGKKIVIGDIVRTPWGFEGGSLSNYTAVDLLTETLKEIVARSGVDANKIESVITGCCNQGTANMNIARIGAQSAGIPNTSTDSSVQLNCVSGLESILRSVHKVLSPFDGDLYISSAVEGMSQFGGRITNLDAYNSALLGMTSAYGKEGFEEKYKEFVDNNAIDEETGFNSNVLNCIVESLTDRQSDMSMAECAEIIANIYNVSKESQDLYSYGCLKKSIEAIEAGKLDNYVMSLKDKDGNDLHRDEYPLKRQKWLKKGEEFFTSKKPFINEGAAWLTPDMFYKKHAEVMKSLGFQRDKIDPSVTLWSSCGNADGASSAIVTTEEMAKKEGLNIKAEIVSWAYSGVHPAVMGIGPLYSTVKALENANLKMEDIDIIEIHEPFAATVLACMSQSEKEFGIKWDESKMNTLGGTLFYRHPLGATFFRLITNIFTRFDENPEAKYALATSCAGGGLGGTLILKRP
ncbi:MAG: thiolase family protein [Pseudomonadota bacterium]